MDISPDEAKLVLDAEDLRTIKKLGRIHTVVRIKTCLQNV